MELISNKRYRCGTSIFSKFLGVESLSKEQKLNQSWKRVTQFSILKKKFHSSE